MSAILTSSLPVFGLCGLPRRCLNDRQTSARSYSLLYPDKSNLKQHERAYPESAAGPIHSSLDIKSKNQSPLIGLARMAEHFPERREQDDPVLNLVQAYHELNPAVVEELDAEPTPLQFMRFVAKNRPFVVRKGACAWRAVLVWDSAYLRKVMDGRSVNVAITPTG